MLTVYTAKSIITMNPSLPRAEAVVVRDGRIVEVGTRKTIQPWLDMHPHEFDDQFKNDIIVPGFIDPHLHPTMAAVLLPMEFITATEWRLPWGTVTPCTTTDTFDTRMQELAEKRTSDEPLFIWGYHQLWHGEMSRTRINEITGNQPTIVWHRSFHELYLNNAACSFFEIEESEVAGVAQIDFEKGHFFETGLAFAISKLNPFLLSKERYQFGMERLRQVVHHGGHTTIADMGAGIFDFDLEWSTTKAMFDGEDTPFRTELVVNALRLRHGGKTNEEVLAFADEAINLSTDRLVFSKRIKLFSDGAFFSQLAQMFEPGYIDGHDGEWLIPPEYLEDMVRTYWHAGYQIHLHVTGDLGLELGLDVLETMQSERPRFNHGFTFEHFGFSTPEQVRRIAQLGANVSANIYYLYELSDRYAQQGIGYERSSQIGRLNTCFKHNILTTLHSDFTMAPAEPLTAAWVAVNRINCVGEQMAATECISVQQALEAITINAAHVLGRADDIGSIRAGKFADFTVLGADPLTIDPIGLKDIPIRATVSQGRVFPLPN